eukprot:TRINITY_DN488_c1_g1_i1.p1 TRINITY_DN488_c1_g1~~TRINITY_DN488_c1_g1_i1.p1  ORF type:complete len:467 (+),score=107.48 TRINITY_DN488_c1_g1_i1:65-1402(+)
MNFTISFTVVAATSLSVGAAVLWGILRRSKSVKRIEQEKELSAEEEVEGMKTETVDPTDGHSSEGDHVGDHAVARDSSLKGKSRGKKGKLGKGFQSGKRKNPKLTHESICGYVAGHPSRISCFVQCSTILCVCFEDGWVHLHDPELVCSGKSTAQPLARLNVRGDFVKNCDISFDGHFLLLVTDFDNDMYIYLLRRSSGGKIRIELGSHWGDPWLHGKTVVRACLFPKRRLSSESEEEIQKMSAVAAVLSNSTIGVWNVRGERLQTIDLHQVRSFVADACQSRTLLCVGTQMPEVRVFSAEHSKEGHILEWRRRCICRGNAVGVKMLAFSNSGSFMVTCSIKGQLIAFDMQGNVEGGVDPKECFSCDCPFPSFDSMVVTESLTKETEIITIGSYGSQIAVMKGATVRTIIRLPENVQVQNMQMSPCGHFFFTHCAGDHAVYAWKI